jgi:hypothetical protein
MRAAFGPLVGGGEDQPMPELPECTLSSLDEGVKPAEEISPIAR